MVSTTRSKLVNALTDLKTTPIILSPEKISKFCYFKFIDDKTGLFAVPIAGLTHNHVSKTHNYLKISCDLPEGWRFDPAQKKSLYLDSKIIENSIFLIWRLTRSNSNIKFVWPSILYSGTLTKD